MGFFFTAASADSRVPSGTLTPEPQVSNPGSRYYSPGMGRWLSRDPLGGYGGPNYYAFVRNRPTSSVDLLGLRTKTECETEIDEAIKESPELAALVEKLKNGRRKVDGTQCLAGKPICDCCYQEFGYFSQRIVDYTFGWWAVVCYQKAVSVKMTMLHEMQHAAESCYLDDPTDCQQQTCEEARARYCSGMSERDARNTAHNSSMAHPLCKGVTAGEIANMAQSCELKKEACYVPRPEKPLPEQPVSAQ
jgi:RHS repeat-associated protein